MKRLAIFAIIVICFLMILASCSAPSPSPTYSGEDPQSNQIKPRPNASPSHHFQFKDIIMDSQYWNTGWYATELYQTLLSINKSYREKHTYIEDVFDCDDMTIDLWNMFYKQGITSVIVVGNLDMNNERLRECDHTWLLIIHRGEDALYQLFIIESTNGEVYAFDKNTRAFEQYLQGYCYSSPSDLREDTE